MVSRDLCRPPVTHLGRSILLLTKSLSLTSLRGPLIVCLILSVLLSFKAPTNQASLVFAAVFVSVWIGSAIVTFNAQLLGGTISFFQSVCVMGYCVFPMTVSAFIIGFLRLTPLSWLWMDLIWLFLGFLWAIRSSSVFIGMYIKRERRFLAVFPVFFFYIFLGWMILLF
jgi:protein YIPF6